MRANSRLSIGLSLTAFALLATGCGPSPAMQSRPPEPLPSNAAVVVICDDDDDVEEVAETPKKPVEYVRIDEWQPPPSVRETEARIEPRGNKPPDYVRLPRLKLHREIAPSTTFRTGRYWH